MLFAPLLRSISYRHSFGTDARSQHLSISVSIQFAPSSHHGAAATSDADAHGRRRHLLHPDLLHVLEFRANRPFLALRIRLQDIGRQRNTHGRSGLWRARHHPQRRVDCAKAGQRNAEVRSRAHTSFRTPPPPSPHPSVLKPMNY